MFRKKIEHEIFGDLRFKNGCWRGVRILEAKESEVEVLFDSTDSEFLDKCVSIWAYIESNISEISNQVESAVIEYCSADKEAYAKLDKCKISDSVEQIHFLKSGFFWTMWGFQYSNLGEYDLGVTLEHNNGTIRVIGIVH